MSSTNAADIGAAVLRCADLEPSALPALLERFGLDLVPVEARGPIPGSFWGEPEAGLVENRLYVRADTPVHSALHETCHYVCMDEERRMGLDTDAGGDYREEDAVCYLQILLADTLPGVGRERMFADMDAWGYSFRLGSARRWFESDADDAQSWLASHGLVDEEGQPTWQLRH